MICPNCQKPTGRLRFYRGRGYCAKCLGVSEAAGFKIDGSLTRSADRIREQQMRHEGDLIMPHMFDHNTKTLVPNPDFIKRYPDRVTSSYTQTELEKAGHSKVDKLFKQDEDIRAAHNAELDNVTYRHRPIDGQSVDDTIAGFIGDAAP